MYFNYFKIILKVFLQFIAGIIGSVLGFIFFISTFCFKANSVSSPTVGDMGCRRSDEFLVPIIIYFGTLFGIWAALRLMKYKTNNFYLIITVAILLVIQFFVSNVFSKAIIERFNGISFLGVPLILTIVANYFISKPTKSVLPVISK